MIRRDNRRNEQDAHIIALFHSSTKAVIDEQWRQRQRRESNEVAVTKCRLRKSTTHTDEPIKESTSCTDTTCARRSFDELKIHDDFFLVEFRREKFDFSVIDHFLVLLVWRQSASFDYFLNDVEFSRAFNMEIFDSFECLMRVWKISSMKFESITIFDGILSLVHTRWFDRKGQSFTLRFKLSKTMFTNRENFGAPFDNTWMFHCFTSWIFSFFKWKNIDRLQLWRLFEIRKMTISPLLVSRVENRLTLRWPRADKHTRRASWFLFTKFLVWISFKNAWKYTRDILPCNRNEKKNCCDQSISSAARLIFACGKY